MVEFLFIMRHTPFWAVPFMILGAEFAYLFWLRKKKRSAAIWGIIAFIGLVAICFYAWAGGPEKTVKYLKRIYIEHRE